MHYDYCYQALNGIYSRTDDLKVADFQTYWTQDTDIIMIRRITIMIIIIIMIIMIVMII